MDFTNFKGSSVGVVVNLLSYKVSGPRFEISYLMLPCLDMTEIMLKPQKTLNQPWQTEPKL